MKFLTFGSTMGDAYTDNTKAIAAKKVFPELLAGLGLRLASIGLLGWGIVSGFTSKKASVINAKTLSGAGLFVVSGVMAQDAVSRFENHVAANERFITLKPHA